MKTLYLECKMGASGDTLMSALYEILPDQAAFLDTMNHLHEGVHVTMEKKETCGILGTHATVDIGGEEEESQDLPCGCIHTHGEAHDHDHDHSHDCAHDCTGCESHCEHTPMEELTALMQYMVGHNAAHARELADLAVQLDQNGNHTAYEQVMAAVSDFEKGNLRLTAVLSSLKG